METYVRAVSTLTKPREREHRELDTVVTKKKVPRETTRRSGRRCARERQEGAHTARDARLVALRRGIYHEANHELTGNVRAERDGAQLVELCFHCFVDIVQLDKAAAAAALADETLRNDAAAWNEQ